MGYKGIDCTPDEVYYGLPHPFAKSVFVNTAPASPNPSAPFKTVDRSYKFSCSTTLKKYRLQELFPEPSGKIIGIDDFKNLLFFRFKIMFQIPFREIHKFFHPCNGPGMALGKFAGNV